MRATRIIVPPVYVVVMQSDLEAKEIQ